MGGPAKTASSYGGGTALEGGMFEERRRFEFTSTSESLATGLQSVRSSRMGEEGGIC